MKKHPIVISLTLMPGFAMIMGCGESSQSNMPAVPAGQASLASAVDSNAMIEAVLANVTGRFRSAPWGTNVFLINNKVLGSQGSLHSYETLKAAEAIVGAASSCSVVSYCEPKVNEIVISFSPPQQITNRTANVRVELRGKRRHRITGEEIYWLNELSYALVNDGEWKIRESVLLDAS